MDLVDGSQTDTARTCPHPFNTIQTLLCCACWTLRHP